MSVGVKVTFEKSCELANLLIKFIKIVTTHCASDRWKWNQIYVGRKESQYAFVSDFEKSCKVLRISQLFSGSSKVEFPIALIQFIKIVTTHCASDHWNEIKFMSVGRSESRYAFVSDFEKSCKVLRISQFAN